MKKVTPLGVIVAYTWVKPMVSIVAHSTAER